MWYFLVALCGFLLGIVLISCMAISSQQERCKDCILYHSKGEVDNG